MIDDWMPTLKKNLAAIDGIKQVHSYDDIPATISVVPLIIVLPLSGSQFVMAGGPNIGIHNVQVVLYFSAQILPEAYGQAVPYIEKVLKAVAGDIKLSGNCEYCMPVDPPEPWYEGPGAIDYLYAGKAHVGIVFRLLVKEDVSLRVE